MNRDAGRSAVAALEATGGIGITEEHVALRETVRRWSAAHCPPAVPRALLDAERETLPPFWGDLVERGWLGLHVPEAHGGEGFGLAELAVVLEELGRACAPGPFLPSALAAAAVHRFGGDALAAELLADLVSGRRIGTVGFGCAPVPASRTSSGAGHTGRGAATPGGAERPNAGLPAGITDADRAAPEGVVLDGTWDPVLSGGLADILILPVSGGSAPAGDSIDGGEGSASEGEDLVHWVVLDAAAVEVEPRPSLDRTRRVARVRAAGLTVPAQRVLRCPAGAAGVEGLAARLLAAECVGVAAWCVTCAAEYAKVREQFGRPIGQFQAVKHRCADMLGALERARAAAWDSMQSPRPWRASDAGGGHHIDSADGDTARDRARGDRTGDGLAAAVAGALAPEAAYRCAKDCIQVLGGIGFTWEHDAHVYLKRAAANRALLGGPGPWRARVTERALAGERRHPGVTLPAEAEVHRQEVRAFVDDLRRRDASEWRGRLAETGYLVPHYPAPWGRDASPLEQLVIDEELRRARVRRPHLGVGTWVLPTLVVHATPAQQERWILPSLRGEITWCQMFSEPGAGSDLASLSTKATRVDGGWLLTGQKVWTSMAHAADWGLCLARTDPSAPRHEGIGCFCVDMRSAGIEVRPLRELTGAEMFNEVFLSDVFVPDDCVVGEPTAGWQVARTTLANERVSIGQGASMGPGVEALLAVAAGRAREDPLVRDTLGAVIADTQAHAALGVRMTLRALQGAAAGPEASVRKLLGVELDQRVQEVGLDLLGAGAVSAGDEAAPWIGGFLANRALSIAGGTSEIQRNVVAERLLGLPRDP